MREEIGIYSERGFFFFGDNRCDSLNLGFVYTNNITFGMDHCVRAGLRLYNTAIIHT